MTESHPPRFQPVSVERHANRWWRPASSYAWAAQEVIVPLVGGEMPRAALHLPMAFIRSGTALVPAAVLGLQNGVNLFVASDGGRWIGGYVPALLRSRPFALLAALDGRKVLCVDEQAGRVSDQQEDAPAQPFFGADAKPAPGLQQVMNFLTTYEANRELTARACAALELHKVIVPWDVKLNTGSTTRDVAGLHRIDEAALVALADEAFLELRRAGALALAYAQLISMPQLALLGQLASARAAALQQPMAPVTPSGDLDLSFLERGGTLQFS